MKRKTGPPEGDGGEMNVSPTEFDSFKKLE